MSDKQKTSLEQFAIALYEKGFLTGNGDEIQNLLDPHLEIHKKEVIDALLFGDVHSPMTAEQYYKEKYEEEKMENETQKIDGYWVIGTNKWNANIFTKEEAEKQEKTLINCSNCIDCIRCRNCSGCRDCSSCSGCIDCNKCIDCGGCSDCRGCSGCRRCSGSCSCNSLTNLILVHVAKAPACSDQGLSIVRQRQTRGPLVIDSDT
jgi:hypothetical protein